jgi:Ca2+/Na+ antiporter
VYGNFNINELTIILSAVYLAILFLVIMVILRKRIGFWMGTIIVVAVLCIVFGVNYLQKEIHGFDKKAIVIAKSSDVKYGPFDDATTYFEVYEGDKVNVLLKKDDWIKIKRLDNKLGWMEIKDVERI